MAGAHSGPTRPSCGTGRGRRAVGVQPWVQHHWWGAGEGGSAGLPTRPGRADEEALTTDGRSGCRAPQSAGRDECRESGEGLRETGKCRCATRSGREESRGAPVWAERAGCTGMPTKEPGGQRRRRGSGQGRCRNVDAGGACKRRRAGVAATTRAGKAGPCVRGPGECRACRAEHVYGR